MTLRANYHPEETTKTSTVLVKGVKVTIGHPEAKGVDYAYTAVGDTTEQELEIVGIIPSMCRVIVAILKCISNCDLTVNTDVGITGGGNEVISAGDCDDLNDIISIEGGAGLGSIPILNNNQSVYVNSTPGANWDTMTSGKWELYIVYVDNSLVE